MRLQVLFSDLIKKKGSSFPDSPLRRKLLELHNGIVVVLLKHRASGRMVALGNLQLFWKPDFPHVKAVQAELACKAVTSFRDRQASKLKVGKGVCAGGEGGSWIEIPIVLCGDLNSVRDMQLEYLPSFQREALEEALEGAEEGQGFAPPGHERSGVFQLLREGVLEQAHPQHPDSFKRANAPKPWSQMTPEEKKRMRLLSPPTAFSTRNNGAPEC